MANAKSQVRKVGGLKTRARMFRTVLLGGALGAAGLTISPTVRSEVVGRIKDVALVDRYSFIEADNVSSESPTIAGFEPQLIYDGSRNRAWGAAWGFQHPGEVLPPDTGCLGGEFPKIRIALAEPSDIDRMRIWGGTWAEDEARELRHRPLMLQLQPFTPDGSAPCTFAKLENTAEPQSIELDLKDVVALDVTIVGVYLGVCQPVVDGDCKFTDEPVAVSELWLERRR